MNLNKHWRTAQTTEGVVQSTRANSPSEFPLQKPGTEHSLLKQIPLLCLGIRDQGGWLGYTLHNKLYCYL